MQIQAIVARSRDVVSTGFAKALLHRLWLGLTSTSLVACASTPAPRDVRFFSSSSQAAGAKNSRGGPVTQFEMQQSVQRFTGDFLNRISDAGEPLFHSKNSEIC